MITIAFMVGLTILADSLTAVEVTEGINTATAGEFNNTFAGLISFMGTFFDILTFQLDGIPPAVNLLLFLPITFGMLYIIVEIVKDLIPFT